MTGWDATGRLEALWGKVGGRDGLARLTGIQGGTLSGYNTGRLKLGQKNAERIAAALEVSLLDLDKPADPEIPAERLVLDRLATLEAADEARREELEALAQLAAGLVVRVERLEGGASQRERQS